MYTGKNFLNIFFFFFFFSSSKDLTIFLFSFFFGFNNLQLLRIFKHSVPTIKIRRMLRASDGRIDQLTLFVIDARFQYLRQLFPRCPSCTPWWTRSRRHTARSNAAYVDPAPLWPECSPAEWCLVAPCRSCTRSNRDSCRSIWTTVSSSSCNVRLKQPPRRFKRLTIDAQPQMRYLPAVSVRAAERQSDTM